MNLSNLYYLFKKQNFNIDSLALKIDINAINFTQQGRLEFYSNLITIDEYTGEIVKFHKADNLILNTNTGIKAYAYKKVEFGKEYVVFSLSSKYLLSDYFRGLNLDTISLAYNTFSEIYKDYLFIDYFVFLNSNVFDIDVFTDFLINDYEFLNLTKEFKSLSDNFTSYKSRGIITGLQHLTRGYKNNKLLYFKFYRKLLELEKRSKQFYNTYLSGKVKDDLLRFEYTLKNSNQIRSYLNWKSKPLTLVNLLTHRHKGYKVLLPFLELSVDKNKIHKINNDNFSNSDYFLYYSFLSWKRNLLKLKQVSIINNLITKSINDNDSSLIDDLNKYLSNELTDYLKVDIYEAFFIDLYGEKRPKKIQKYITRKKLVLKNIHSANF